MPIISPNDHLSSILSFTSVIHLLCICIQPELINKREHDEFDSRSDVWSLAISLLELSIGCYPYFKMNPKFKEMKMFAKLVTILQEDAPKVPENAGFSREYKEFISQWWVTFLLIIVDSFAHNNDFVPFTV